MSAITPADPFALDLSAAYMIAVGGVPFVAGDDNRLRLQIRKDGEPVDLTGATVWWTMRDKIGGPGRFQRKSGVEVGDGPLLQVTIDADQTEETIDEDGNASGKGWVEVAWSDEDEDVLRLFCGLLRPWDLRVLLADGLLDTYAKGRIEWLRAESDDVT